MVLVGCDAVICTDQLARGPHPASTSIPVITQLIIPLLTMTVFSALRVSCGLGKKFTTVAQYTYSLHHGPTVSKAIRSDQIKQRNGYVTEK